jgi:hypothetical protein
MKKILKVVGVIFALGAVILLGLHLFLQYGLTKTLNEVVLPRLEAETGIRAEVGRLSVNLPNGKLSLQDVSVKNPDGFVLEDMVLIERIDLSVDMMSLLKQKLVRVQRVDVQNALVNVIRNQAGDVNVNQLKSKSSPPQPAEGKSPVNVTEQPTGKEPEAAVSPAQPLPEILIEALRCNLTLRYLDFKLNQLDLSLDLRLAADHLSTLRDPLTPWANLALMSSVGSEHTRFVTDLRMKLAPVVDPQVLSFDLTGQIMEIDPRMLDKIYSKLGIRSAPFGLTPRLQCRKNQFENSALSFEINKIVFEDKLSDRLGGLASIDSLKFSAPVEGSLQEPKMDLMAAFKGGLGGTAQTVVESFIKGALAKEAGLDKVPDDLTDAAVDLLGAKVSEVGDSETLQKVLKDLANGKSGDTNAPPVDKTDVAVEVLGEQIDEVGESEAVKKALKDLANGKSTESNAPPVITSDLLINILGEQVDEIGEDEALKDDLKSLGKLLFGR